MWIIAAATRRNRAPYHSSAQRFSSSFDANNPDVVLACAAVCFEGHGHFTANVSTESADRKPTTCQLRDNSAKVQALIFSASKTNLKLMPQILKKQMDDSASFI